MRTKEEDRCGENVCLREKEMIMRDNNNKKKEKEERIADD